MIKVILRGPLLTQSGYGHHARTVLRALRSRQDVFDIYIQPIPWGQTGWLWVSNEEREWIDEKIKNTVAHINQGQQFDMSIQVTIPNEWEKLAPINIGVTAGMETTKVAAKWIEKSFLMDRIITISQFSKDSYINTVYEATNNQTNEKFDYRVQVPVEYVSYPVRKFKPEQIDLELSTDFNFLTVAQLSPRKNAAQLIRCFVENFKDNDNVGLIVKANLAKNSLLDRNNTLMQLQNQIAQYSDRKCKIYLLHGYLSDEEMAGLYTHPKVKAIVSATHGEGFGLPLFEAAYYGLPVIATDWSGHLDFLYMPQKQKNGKEKKKHMFSKISYTLQNVQQEAVWQDVIVPDSMWAFPEEGSIKMNLDEVYKDHGRFKKRAKQLEKWICDEFEEQKQNEKMINLIYPSIEEFMNDDDLNNLLDDMGF